MKTDLSKSIKTLTEALKKDKDYYMSWQANLAVCMQDAFSQRNNDDTLHDITNNGAKRFLDLLTRDTNENND